MTSSVSQIKRAQKESLLFREISDLFLKASLDNSLLRNISISRVSLSADKGICTIYFYTVLGKEAFDKTYKPLLLKYKHQFRKELASRIRSRYTPDLVIAFDDHFEKQMRLEELLERFKKEDEE